MTTSDGAGGAANIGTTITPRRRARRRGRRPAWRSAAARLVTSALAVILLAVTTIALTGARRPHSASDRPSGPAPPKRVIVLGIDGMDFALTRSLMEQGRLPNLSALAGEGSFLPLQTSMPPLSPVAWSNFITGTNPGGHGVFDFLRRDPQRVGDDLLPEDGVARTDGERHALEQVSIPFTPYAWPDQPKPRLVRSGATLWEAAESAGVPTTIYKAPANFPVTDGRGEVLAGMGTPDVEGTYGTFTYLTSRTADWGRPVRGGRVLRALLIDGEVKVLVDGAAGGLANPRLIGPVNPFLRTDTPGGPRHVETPFEVHVDAESRAVAITLQGRDVILESGEWGPWLEVRFELLPQLKSVRGLVCMYLQEAAPSLRLFVSPVHLAPGSEGLSSGRFDLTLEDALGPYYTKGMSEETKAFTQGLFDADEYLKQSDLVLAGDVRALDFLLARPRGGLLFVYFSTLDLNCHVMWKYQDAAHPAYDAGQASPRHAGSITDLYARLDAVVGKARTALRPGDALYVMSDHGFSPMYREFNLQTWLAAEGYLAFKPAAAAGKASKTLADVDWPHTRAYGLGFQSVYLNLRGRESTGVVPPESAGALAAEIRGKLLALRDHDRSTIFRGRRVFDTAYRPAEIYSGPRTIEAPDLVVGYARGYGPSDDTVLGAAGDAALAPHTSGFSGHHTNDFGAVPGVLFSSQKLRSHQARLEDVTVTVLRDLGVPAAEKMTGKAID